jgi:hypothetical protein
MNSRFIGSAQNAGCSWQSESSLHAVASADGAPRITHWLATLPRFCSFRQESGFRSSLSRGFTHIFHRERDFTRSSLVLAYWRGASPVPLPKSSEVFRNFIPSGGGRVLMILCRL